jgi:5-oxoprolinase (ATP-hydrolysing)
MPAEPPAPDRWTFWVDRGGTFTDVVGLSPGGEVVVTKVLSERPGGARDAVVQGIRDALGLAESDLLPTQQIGVVKMGTTVATNALLERTGTPTVLVATEGFGDGLRIRTQNRPDLFARHVVLPEPLYARAVEAPERTDAAGHVLRPLDADVLRERLAAAFEAGCRSCAVALVHSVQNGAHEVEAGRIAAEVGFEHVVLSHRVSPLVKWVRRGDTVLVEAYVGPALGRYVRRVQGVLGEARVLCMQSNGGLVAAEGFRGKDALLSGPAGGVVGAVAACRAEGVEELVAFDMGGTSTDVSYVAGTFERADEAEVAGVRVRAPMLAVETVAAGGGSVCRVEAGRAQVGPDSAGADPGPACYGRGGPATVTDCNVALGKIQPDAVPAVFGEDGDAPLDADASRAALAALADGEPVEALAEGLLTVAVENMAHAIRAVSLERGRGLEDVALCAFGGAGGQHACRLADVLGLDRVLIHPLAGVLSAYGIGVADVRDVRQRSVERALDADAVEAAAVALADLEAEARAHLVQSGTAAPDDPLDVRRTIRLRYRGADAALDLPFDPSADALRAAFDEKHRQRFGFAQPGRAVTAASAGVEVVRTGEVPDLPPPSASGPGEPERSVRVYTAGRWSDAPLWHRAALGPGAEVEGPALVAEETGTTVVEPGWRATVAASGTLVLTRTAEVPVAEAPEAVRLEVFANRFRAVAEQMGVALQQTAHSVNIRERLDFSCAVFDGDGALVANAPHIPVHLGSMGESVRAVVERFGGEFAEGDAFVLNDPFAGGTHLPDVTVVMPVFAGEARPSFFVAARGHHADVGGVTPGSVPPQSTRIEEEGVLIRPMRLVVGGRFLDEAWRTALASGPHPARLPDQNTADVQAQVAACARGADALRQLAAAHGAETVAAWMGRLHDHAEEAVRRALGQLSDGQFACRLDTGETVRVSVSVDAETRTAHVDWTGTSPQTARNVNAPAAVTRAVVLYVVRTLLGGGLPLNDGCLRPIELAIPEGSLLAPRPPAAVVAGNVETSQIAADALFGALGLLAGSQGTMNNLTFGTDRFQYYETLCGGTGAGPDHPGTSAVHSHMTNSLLTDPEILEMRFPVRLERFSIRRGSGGAGRQPGGDGVVRVLRFLEPMTVSVLSGRRRVAPHGLAGGADGAPGLNTLLRADGTETDLGGTATVEVEPGDRLRIETPGGGGYGPPP